MSSFSGLSVALSSLQSQRRVLDVVAQNTANVNTPGYTRQRAELQSLDPSSATGMWGTQPRAGDGVQVASVARLSDDVAMARLRGQTANAGYHAATAEHLAAIEENFGEPSDTGLTERIAQMFSAWGDVSNNPDSAATLAVLKQQSVSVTDAIRDGYADVAARFDAARNELSAMSEEVTTAAASIAELNEEIFRATNSGVAVNGLLDQRDQLITKLAEYAGVTTAPGAGGMVDVSLGGQPLVSGQTSRSVALTGDVSFPGAAGANVGLSVAGVPVTLATGSMAANVKVLNTTLPQVAQGYDNVALSLRDLVNTETGQTFFAATSGRDITVAIGDPATIVASDLGRDGAIADRIAEKRTAVGSPAAQWASLLGDVGVQARSAQQRAATAEMTRSSAESALTAVTSVDIDEEMTHLIATQRAYEAAGKLMATIDSMLDTLINGIGR